MPQHYNRNPNEVGPAQSLAGTARGVSGVPIPGVTPPAAGTTGDLSEILAQLGAGQLSAEQLIALLTALTGLGAGGIPGQVPPGAGGASPIDAAFLGGLGAEEGLI